MNTEDIIMSFSQKYMGPLGMIESSDNTPARIISVGFGKNSINVNWVSTELERNELKDASNLKLEVFPKTFLGYIVNYTKVPSHPFHHKRL